MWLYHRVMSPNDSDGMANSVDPDRVCTVCPDLSAGKLITVILHYPFQISTCKMMEPVRNVPVAV